MTPYSLNLHRVELQLGSLERLAPYLAQHGCDISAQDAARSLMHYFDESAPAREDKALALAYDDVRERLKEVAEGRSGRLPISKIATFIRCYREHLLRAESVLVHPVSISSQAGKQLDS